MKKQLLCTSAIALGCAVAAPASAQDWDLSWGGFMNQHVAFSDISGTLIAPGFKFDGDGVDIHSTSELIFTPSITLDNGLTFGVNIQIEGENVGARVDETYMSITGDSLGRIDLGSENSAGYKLMVAAPTVTSMAINSPSTSAFLPITGTLGSALNTFRQAHLSAYTEVAGNNDVQRLTYYTPDFNGFTLGISYAPTGAANAFSSLSILRSGPGVATISDIFDIGVNYSQSFGTTDVSFGARWGTGNSSLVGVSDPETWGVGFQVGFNGITVGGSYAENDNGVATGAGDQEGWSFGVTYDAPGPWAFEALTYQGELQGAGVAKLDREAYKIGASRDLGPGVDWDIYLIQEERNINVLAGTEVEGTIFGTAINLSF